MTVTYQDWYNHFIQFYKLAKANGIGEYWSNQGAIDYAERMIWGLDKKMRVTIKNSELFHADGN